jgi:hypothetical protein
LEGKKILKGFVIPKRLCGEEDVERMFGPETTGIRTTAQNGGTPLKERTKVQRSYLFPGVFVVFFASRTT